MRRLLGMIFTLVLLALWTPSEARNTHGLPSEGDERSAYFGETFDHGFVVSGCKHATSANTQVTMPACAGYTKTVVPSSLRYFQEVNTVSITYAAGNGTYWLIAHDSRTEAVGGWTRVANSHYLYQLNATQPALQARSIFLAKVTLSGGAITTVNDMRDGRPDTYDIDVTAPIYGATGDGSTNDAAAFGLACTAARDKWFADFVSPNGAAQKILIPGGRIYNFTSQWTCNLTSSSADNPEMHIEATGATLQLSFDGTLVDFSPSTSCTTTAGDWAQPPLRKLWWNGGKFTGPGVASVNSKIMKMYGIRGVHVSNTTVGFVHTVMDVCVQDNFHLTKNRWGTFVYGVHQPDATVDEVTTAQSGASSSLMHFSYNNFGAGVDCVAIFGLLGNVFQNVTFIGNSFQGSCSGGWVHMQTGDINVRPNQNIVFIGNTAEQAGDNDFGIRLVQRAAATEQYYGTVIIGNEFRFSSTAGFTVVSLQAHDGVVMQGNFIESKNATGWLGVVLDNIDNFSGGGNIFEATTGTGYCWKMLTDNSRVNLGSFTCTPGTGPVVTMLDAGGTGRRWQYRSGTGYRILANDFDNVGTNSLDGSAGLSDSSFTLQLDNSSNLQSDFSGGQGIIPWGYVLRVQMWDTGSAAATALDVGKPIPFIQFGQTGGAVIGKTLFCSSQGMVNSAEVMCEGVVRANATGGVVVTINATGVATLFARVYVTAVIE